MDVCFKRKCIVFMPIFNFEIAGSQKSNGLYCLSLNVTPRFDTLCSFRLYMLIHVYIFHHAISKFNFVPITMLLIKKL